MDMCEWALVNNNTVGKNQYNFFQMIFLTLFL